MQIFSIPAHNSFLDSLAQGLIKRELGADNLILLPSKTTLNQFKNLLAKYNYQGVLPEIICFSDLDDLKDPFLKFTTQTKINPEFTTLELKLFFSERFISWQQQVKKHNPLCKYIQQIEAVEFCTDFLKFFYELQEGEIDIEQLCNSAKNLQANLVLNLKLDFLNFVYPHWLKSKEAAQKQTIIEKQNQIINFKAKFLKELNHYQHIILAGTTALNQATQQLLTKLLELKNSIFIYQTEHRLNHEFLGSFSPNLAVKLLKQNFNLNESVIWHDAKNINKHQLPLINCTSLNQQAEYLAARISKQQEARQKTHLITNNLDLAKLVLAKLNLNQEATIATNQNKQATEFFKLAKLLFNLNYHYLDSEDFALPENYQNLGFTEKLELLKNYAEQDEFTQMLFAKFINLFNSKKFSLKALLNFLSKETQKIQFSNEYLVICQPKDARLVHPENAFLADISQDNFSANLDEIFKQNLLTELGKYNFLELRQSLISSDFVQQLNNPQITLSISQTSKGKNVEEFILLNNYQARLVRQNYNYLSNFASDFPKYQHIMVKPPTLLRKHNFSVTGIEKLLRNPYAIYVEKILKLKKSLIFFKEQDNLIFGNLLHHTIDDFLKNDELYDEAAAIKLFLQIFTKKLRKYHLAASISAAWQIRAKFLAPEFVRLSLGQEILAEHPLKLKLTKLGIDLTCRIDRLEIHPDQIIISDYKTGSIPTNKDLENGIALQLILTGLICDAHFKDKEFSAHYWQLIGKYAEEIKIIEIANLAELINKAQTQLENVIAIYQNSNTPLIAFPNPQLTTSYDPYYHLARRDKV